MYSFEFTLEFLGHYLNHSVFEHILLADLDLKYVKLGGGGWLYKVIHVR